LYESTIAWALHSAPVKRADICWDCRRCYSRVDSVDTFSYVSEHQPKPCTVGFHDGGNHQWEMVKDMVGFSQAHTPHYQTGPSYTSRAKTNTGIIRKHNSPRTHILCCENNPPSNLRRRLLSLEENSLFYLHLHKSSVFYYLPS